VSSAAGTPAPVHSSRSKHTPGSASTSLRHNAATAVRVTRAAVPAAHQIEPLGPQPSGDGAQTGTPPHIERDPAGSGSGSVPRLSAASKGDAPSASHDSGTPSMGFRAQLVSTAAWGAWSVIVFVLLMLLGDMIASRWTRISSSFPWHRWFGVESGRRKTAKRSNVRQGRVIRGHKQRKQNLVHSPQ
jgi:hypothetical protein